MFYLLHGPDKHSKAKTLANLQSKLGDPQMLELNTTRLEGKGLALNELQAACNAMPFLSPKRLIIVENFVENADKKLVKDAAVYFEKLPDTARLVLLESKKVGVKNAIHKLAAENKKVGYVKLFEEPKGNALERWIRDAVKERGGQIAPRSVHMLASNVGSNLVALENEVEKLVLFKGTNLIQPADVELMSPYSAETNIFDLVDAIGNRNGRKASLLLNDILREGKDPFYLFTMIVRQFRLLIQVKAALEDGVKRHEIAKTVGLHPFVAGKMSKQVGSFSLGQLEQIYAHLLEIDVGVKTGSADMTTSLNLLVGTLAN